MNDNRAQSSKLSAAGVSSPAEAAGASARGLRQSFPRRSRHSCLPISNRNIPLLDTSVSACKHMASLFLIATLSLLLRFATHRKTPQPRPYRWTLIRGPAKVSPRRSAAARRALLLGQFDVERDLDVVADHEVAARQLVAVVGQAEILAVDRRRCGDAPADTHYLDGGGGAGHVERNFLRDAVNRQVSGHFEGAVAGLRDLRGLEGHRGVLH